MFRQAYSILAGLSLTPVYRLKSLWAQLPSSYVSRFKQLSQQLDTARNFAQYRRLWAEGTARGAPQLPYVVVVLKDLFQLEEIDGVE